MQQYPEIRHGGTRALKGGWPRRCLLATSPVKEFPHLCKRLDVFVLLLVLRQNCVNFAGVRIPLSLVDAGYQAVVRCFIDIQHERDRGHSIGITRSHQGSGIGFVRHSWVRTAL